MAAFTTTMTTTSDVDNSIITDMDQQFIVAAAELGIMDQFVTYKKDIGGKSIEFPKYSQLALATTALTENEDPASVALVDAQIIFQPLEYGNVVTTTKLANLQTGGKADLAAARLVGMNMQRTLDKLAVLAAEASSNSLTVDAGAEASLDGSDTMTVTFLNIMYNKLSRASVAPLSEGLYVASLHADVIHDLRNSTGAGSWQDISKYQNSVSVLKGEIGMLAGFRIVQNNHHLISADAGASAIDTYKSVFLGFNGLGKAVSKEPSMTLTGPFDKLGRFVNVGWHGVLKYGIVDTDAVWVGITTSSVGANA